MIGLFRNAVFVLIVIACLAMPVYASDDKPVTMESTTSITALSKYSEIERLSSENFLRVYALEAEARGDKESASVAIVSLLIAAALPNFCIFLVAVMAVYIGLRLWQIHKKNPELTPQQKAEIGKIAMSEVQDDLLKAQLLNAFLVHNNISSLAELKDNRKTEQTVKDENAVSLISLIDDADLKTQLITAVLIKNDNLSATTSADIKKTIETKLSQPNPNPGESSSIGTQS